jgi:polyisoprenoid-binding protein YceI
MRRRFWILAIVGLFSLCLSARDVAAGTFKLDPAHSFIVFEVAHLDLGKAWGLFVAPTGSVTIDDADPSKSFVQVDVKVDSFDTGTPRRDDHVRGPDFFDAKQFPNAGFKSTSVKKTGDNTYEVAGEFTMHGVTKPLTVTLIKLGEKDTVAPFGYRAAFETVFKVKRTDFGITTMGQIVGDEVTLHVNLEGTR